MKLVKEIHLPHFIRRSDEPIVIVEKDTITNKLLHFGIDLCDTVIRKISDFAVGLYHNWEGAALLTAAVSGFCYHIGEIPFWMWLPAWIEGPMVVPVIAVLIVLGLIWSAKRHEKKRFAC